MAVSKGLNSIPSVRLRRQMSQTKRVLACFIRLSKSRYSRPAGRYRRQTLILREEQRKSSANLNQRSDWVHPRLSKSCEPPHILETVKLAPPTIGSVSRNQLGVRTRRGALVEVEIDFEQDRLKIALYRWVRRVARVLHYSI